MPRPGGILPQTHGLSGQISRTTLHNQPLQAQAPSHSPPGPSFLDNEVQAKDDVDFDSLSRGEMDYLIRSNQRIDFESKLAAPGQSHRPTTGSARPLYSDISLKKALSAPPAFTRGQSLRDRPRPSKTVVPKCMLRERTQT